jgi:medium-chain acyl-[acyl-carrier-protein] hydrolase
VCPHTNPSAETRLFFFPYAGGGPSVFTKWIIELPSYLEGYVAHYPGRGSRYQELPIRRFTTLVERLSQAIQPLLDKPFAFFGHSMGGLVAFELIKQLRENNLAQPTILFVSASEAPHLYDPYPPLHKLPDAEFLRALQEFNGTPPEVINHPDLMQLLLPMLRADFEAIENYHYAPYELPLDIPIIAFGGLEDPRVSQEHLEGWALHTNSRFESQYFAGDHFFIERGKESIMRSIDRGILTFPVSKHKSI